MDQKDQENEFDQYGDKGGANHVDEDQHSENFQ